MCTAVSYVTKDHYFGRNLDLEYHYNEQVTVTPRNFSFLFRNKTVLSHHFAIIGMATVAEGYPLYYDATNEYGLSMAGLNFPGNAQYYPPCTDKDNITPFELIPWVLGQCKSVGDAEVLLDRLNLWNEPFSDTLPLSPLHWILCDRKRCIVAEPTKDGLMLYENPALVLTNNPPFPYHTENLKNYMALSPQQPKNLFSKCVPLEVYGSGMGAIGLPGDLSSASRFVRAAFVRGNSVSDESETQSISQFFHILTSVEQQRGCSVVNGNYEITLYSSCCNTDRCIYYYTTYENRRIRAVHLFRENLDSDKIISYPLMHMQDIYDVN